MGLQCGIREAQLEQAVAVGGEEASARAERRDSLHQRADEFRARMEVQGDRVLESGREHLVFDHQRRHPHQGHRMLVVAAAVAADVEHADHVAAVVGDWRGGAGQEVVRCQEVLVGVDRDRRLFGDRGADRIGALAFFRPRHAGLERDLVRLFQEIGVAQRMHDDAVRIGQQHHVMGVDDLLVQRLHGRNRMGIQHAVLFDQGGKVRGGQRAEVGMPARVQSELFGTPVRGGDHCIHVGPGGRCAGHDGAEQAGCRVLVSHSMSPGWPWTAALC